MPIPSSPWRARCAGLHAALLAATFAATLAHGSAAAQGGFVDRAVRIDGEEFRYQVYLPPQTPPSGVRGALLPVVLALHGAGDYGDDGRRQTRGGLGDIVRSHPEQIPAIVVFPQAHADHQPGWLGAGGRAALAALDRSIEEFSGDPAQVALIGFSAGGNGAWHLAAQHPERFAALVVISGFVGDYPGRTGIFYPSLIAKAGADPDGDFARRLMGLPIWIFHGDADPIVPVEEARRMDRALRRVGANVRYTEMAGIGHDTWPRADEQTGVLRWMLQQRRGATKARTP